MVKMTEEMSDSQMDLRKNQKMKIKEKLSEYCNSFDLYSVFCEKNEDLDSFFKYFSTKCYEYGLKPKGANDLMDSQMNFEPKPFDKSQMNNCRFSRRSVNWDNATSNGLNSEFGKSQKGNSYFFTKETKNVSVSLL